MSETSSKREVSTSWQIFWATVLGGPLGGSWFISRNYLVFEKPNKASQTMKLAWACMLLAPISTRLPENLAPESLLSFLPMFLALLLRFITEILQENDIRAAKNAGVKTISNWKLSGISLLWMIVTVSVLFPLSLIMITAGWAAYSSILSVIAVLTIAIPKLPHKFQTMLYRAGMLLGFIAVLAISAFAYIFYTTPPLESPARSGNVHQLEELLNNGADINAKNILGETALLVSARQGTTEVAKILIDKGADLNTSTRLGGYTALYVSSKKGHTDIVRLLLSEDIDVNKKNSHGSTPLTISAEHGHIEIVKLLLDAGADIEAKDDDGHTAFLNAVFGGQRAIVQLLIDKGADVSVKDNAGKNALMLAEEKHYPDIAALIKSQQRK